MSTRSSTGSSGRPSGCCTGSCASTRIAGQDWKAYAKSLIIFSLAGWLLLYFILRTQTLWSFTGLNPVHFHSGPWNVSFNTASSFLTNTNWQYYGGETTMSYFSQMAGLTVQNFLSAGVGIVVAIALIRGIIGRSGKSLGNFWQDLVRTMLWMLLPISFVVALVLICQGSIQNFSHYLSFNGDHRSRAARSRWGRSPRRRRSRSSGPTAAGSSTRTPRTRSRTRRGSRTSSRCCTVLIIPAALVFIYGRMSGNRRQGYAIYATMMVMFLGAVIGLLHRRGARLARPARRRPAHAA